ncbi:ABC transporter substrate-binding protein [Candidatus Nomurabacteria bacterium]|nr:ABC transporter substrate-binding protein [Candidatus Nomurabacteria bacterium]
MKKAIYALCAVALITLAGCGKAEQSSMAEQGPIKIGFIAPISGDLASLGSDALVSAQIAVDEVNQAGGVDGRPIELVVEDGKCSAKDAPQAASKLMNVDNVQVIMAMCSPEVVASSGMANQQKRVLISSCASAPNVTDAGDYVFRTYPSDSFQGKFAAQHAYNTLGKRKAAILSVQNDWGVGLRDVFAQTFEALGGDVVVIQEHTQDSRDMRSQISKIKEANPDIIYFPSFTEPSLVGLKQIRDLEVDVEILGGDAWSDAKLQESSYAQGAQYVQPLSNYSESWKEKMLARGAGATVCAPSAYDNVKIIADIIGSVGEDGEKIKNALYDVKGYAGVAGDITFDENGDITQAQYEVVEL